MTDSPQSLQSLQSLQSMQSIEGESEKDRRRRAARERDARNAVLKPLRQKIEKTERDITAREAEKAGLEPQLAEPGLYDDYARARPLMERMKAVQGELEALDAQWERLQGELEIAEAASAGA